MGYIAAEVQNNHVRVWERRDGKRVNRIFPAPAEFLIKDPRGTDYSIYGDKLRKVTFKNLGQMRAQRERYKEQNVALFESDVNPAIKVLSEHYYGQPGEKINVTFLDIENDFDPVIGYATVSEGDGKNGPYAPINAVAMYHQWKDETVVLAVPPPGFNIEDFDESLLDLADIQLFETEEELLKHLILEIQDADALCGWNSNLFDFPYIGKRIEIVLGENWFEKLSFPDSGRKPSWREQEIFNETVEVLQVGGRILGDYLMLYRKFEQGERESYKLAAIADIHLPELPKLEYEGSLADLYRKDFNYFLRYNIRDTEILKGFERVLGYMDLAVLMFREATGMFDNVTGTVRLADYGIYNFCHHTLGVYVPDIINNYDTQVSLKGAHVLDPTPGMYEMAGSVDVKSLYPSCIRSCNISPETIVGQFTGNWDDVIDISNNSDRPLTFKDEATKQFITEPASVWRELFLANNCAVSGYGTVFSMAKQGVLPSIIERWYDQRGEVNEEIDKVDAQIAVILARSIKSTTAAPDVHGEGRADYPGFGTYPKN